MTTWNIKVIVIQLLLIGVIAGSWYVAGYHVGQSSFVKNNCELVGDSEYKWLECTR